MELASAELIKLNNGRWAPKSNRGFSFNNHKILSIQCEGSVASSILQTGGIVNIRIPNVGTTLIKRCWVRIDTTVSSAAVNPAPTPLWLQQVRFLGGGTNELQKLYGDSIFLSLPMFHDDELTYLTKLYNCSKELRKPVSFPVGNKTVMIPLFGACIEGTVQNLFAQDIFCELTFPSTGCLESGTATNFTVPSNNIFLVMECEDLNAAEFNAFAAKFRSGVSKTIVTWDLCPNALTLSAATTQIIRLQQVRGIVGFLQFFLRASNSNVNGGARTYTPLSAQPDVNKAYFELYSPDNISVSGQPIDTAFARYQDTAFHWQGTAFSKTQNPIYHLIHGDPYLALMEQKIEGCYNYGDGNFQLYLTPGAAGTAETAEIQTLTGVLATTGGTATTATAGTYSVSYKGSTTPELAYNATAATLQAAIRALPSVIEEGIVVTVGGVMFGTASNAVTLTITNLNPEYGVPSQNGGNFVGNCRFGSTTPAALVIINTLTQQGILSTAGASGATNVMIYSARFRNIDYNPGSILANDNVFKA